jgi:hypothetical protein
VFWRSLLPPSAALKMEPAGFAKTLVPAYLSNHSSILFLFCRAWWLMPPDVPQPVRLIVLTLL